jgi:hypothetical protein
MGKLLKTLLAIVIAVIVIAAAVIGWGHYYRVTYKFDAPKEITRVDGGETIIAEGKALYDAEGAFAVRMQKGGAQNEHQVDAITGGTKTCDGVNAMLQSSIGKYESFLRGVEASAEECCDCGECCEEANVELNNEEE